MLKILFTFGSETMATEANISFEDDQSNAIELDPSRPLEGSEEGDITVTEGATVVLEKNDRSVRELYTWFNEGDLNLHPDWQRHYVWDARRASILIESIFMGIPIPVIYLGDYRVYKPSASN